MARAVFLFTSFAIATVGTPAADATAQGRGFIRGGSGTSTSRVVSPTVVASWMSHNNYADGAAMTLLVLWRGTPGWFSKGTGGSSGGGGGSGGGERGDPNGSYGFQSLTEGGLTFRIEYDYDKRIATMLNQEISLKEINIVLVDFVDSTNGPAIVGTRWVDPAASEQPPTADPIASVVKRTPELFEYLRCDLSLPDPVMRVMMPIICGQMRP